MCTRSFHVRGSLSSAGLGQALQHVPARGTVPLLGEWGQWGGGPAASWHISLSITHASSMVSEQCPAPACFQASPWSLLHPGWQQTAVG